MMENIFLTVLNLSIKSSWLILAILFLRYLFSSTSKNFRIVLWGLAGIRLIFPFSFESIFSLIPSKQTVPSDIVFMEVPAIDSGIEAIDHSINPVLAENFTPSPVNSVNPLQIWNYVLAWIWLAGVCCMICYMILSSYRLNRKVSGIAMSEEGIFEDAGIPAPFVFGIFRPKICMPEGISEPERTYILMHERMHVSRRDTLIKPAAFLILAVHWFNPLVWLGWHLLCKDIELACDEAVLDELNEEEQKLYAKTVLDAAYGKTRFAVSPVSFRETGTKERIRNMIRYRKPSLFMAAGALVICALAGCAFLSDPAAGPSQSDQNSPAVSNEVLELEIYPIASDHTALIRRTDEDDLIKEFQQLYDDMRKSNEEDGLSVMKYGYENINDGSLRFKNQYMYFWYTDLSLEMQNENYREAYYIQLYQNTKEEKLLVIWMNHPLAQRLQQLIASMKQLPEGLMPQENFEPVMSGITLIRTGVKDIWCLKDEKLLQTEHLAYTAFSESEVEKALSESGLLISEASWGVPSGSIFDTLKFENYDGQVSLVTNRWILIQMNDDEANELARKLDLCQVTFTVLDTDTGTAIEMPADVQVMLLEDPSFNADHMPLLGTLLHSQYGIQTGTADLVMIPSVQDGALYLDLQFADDGRKASESMRITPDDPDVFDSLNRVFKGTAETIAEDQNGDEMYFLPYTGFPLKPGRYGVEVRNSSICFYLLNESSDQIIMDSGMEFPVYRP